MPPGLIMSDNCLATLAKSESIFIDSDSIIKYLQPGYSFDKYYIKILACLNSITSSTSINQNITLE